MALRLPYYGQAGVASVQSEISLFGDLLPALVRPMRLVNHPAAEETFHA